MQLVTSQAELFGVTSDSFDYRCTVGGSLGGLIGLIIATPLCSVIYVLLSQTVNDKLKKNKIVEKVEEKILED